MNNFNNNQGLGGFQQLQYQIPVVQPVESSWTRQLSQDIPRCPEIKRIVSVKDHIITSDHTDFCSFIVKSPEEVFIVDSDSRTFSPHYSRLIRVFNGKAEEMVRIDKYCKRAKTPVMNINGDILMATKYDTGEQKYYLICISPDFKLKWEYEFDKPVLRKPVVDKFGNIYIYGWTQDTYNPNCYKDGTLYCINADGVLLWERLFGCFSDHVPIMLKNDLIFFGTLEGIYILNQKGEVEKFFNGVGYKWTPVVDKNGVFYLRTEKGIQAWKEDNVIIWSYSNEKEIVIGSPSISANGYLYSKTNYRRLICLDLNGQEKWLVPVKGDADRPPIIGLNGLICHFGTNNGKRYPVSIIQIFDENGNLVWESDYLIGTIVSILPSGDGRLYVLVDGEQYILNRDGNYKASWELYEIS